MDHDFAGFEIFTSKGPYGDDGPGITNALLVGHSEISEITEKGNKSCMAFAKLSECEAAETGGRAYRVSGDTFDRNLQPPPPRLTHSSYYKS